MAEKQSSSGFGSLVVIGIGLLIAWSAFSGAAQPEVTTEDIQISEEIPYESEEEESDELELGDSEVRQDGVPGELITVYRVTYEDGSEVSREYVDEWVETEPVAEVTVYGTYEAVEYDAYSYGSEYDYYDSYDYNSAGCPKNQYVKDHYRAGSYVPGYWRNSPSDSCY